MFSSALLIGLIAASAAHDSAAARRNHAAVLCVDVAGTLVASVTRITPSVRGISIRGVGTSTGDLTGPVVVEALKPYVGGALRVAFTITTSNGRVVARGKTHATALPDSPNARAIQSDLSIAGGSGRFDEAVGSVNAHGRADTHERSLDIEYQGQVCTPL